MPLLLTFRGAIYWLRAFLKQPFEPERDYARGGKMFTQNLSSFDYFSIFLYLLALAFIALKLRAVKQNSAIDYFIAGRRLTLPMFVGTMVATWYGQLAGVSELSFNTGIFSWLVHALFWYGIYIFFAFFIAGKLHSQNYWTLPQYIERHYGKKAGYLAAWINFLKMVPILYILSLALLVRIFFKVDLAEACVIAGVLSVFYCVSGGYRAVVYSDCLQMILMYSAVILVPIYAYKLYGGLDFLQTELPKNHLKLTGGFSFSETLVWAIIPLTTLVNPTFFQRCHTAKSPEIAKKGVLICLIFWGIFDICTTLIGLYARAIIPSVDPKDAIVTLGLTLLPEGLKGLFLVGLMATVMSTIDSHCFVAGQIFAQDIYPKLAKKIPSEKKMICLSKWAMCAVVLMAIVINVYLSFSITFYRKLTGSLATVCLLIPLILALFSNKKRFAHVGYHAMLYGILGFLWFFTSNYLKQSALLTGTFLEFLLYPNQLLPFLFSEGIYLGLFMSLTAFTISFLRGQRLREAA